MDTKKPVKPIMPYIFRVVEHHVLTQRFAYQKIHASYLFPRAEVMETIRFRTSTKYAELNDAAYQLYQSTTFTEPDYE